MQEMKEFSSLHEIKSIFTGYLNKYETSKYYSVSDLFIYHQIAVIHHQKL